MGRRGDVTSTTDLIDLGRRLAGALQRHEDDLVDAAVSDLGFVAADARGEVRSVVEALDRIDGLEAMLDGRGPVCEEGEAVAVLQPYNVVAWPVWDVACLCAPGNSVRMRLSQRSPQISDVIRSIANEAVSDRVEIDNSPREKFLASALEDEAVKLIVAYGSESLGQTLLDRAPKANKRIIFEGPGKDPMVVLPGADPVAVASLLQDAKFKFSGQQCTSTELLVVDRSQHNPVVEAVVEMVGRLSVGDPADPDVDIGPLGSPRVPRNVEEQVADARAKGADVLVGGQVRGQWVQPTVIAGVRPGMLLWSEETFAPVLGIAAVEDADDARRKIHESRFGLHCIVTGRNAEEFAASVTGAAYAEEVETPTFGRFGTATIERRPYSWASDFTSPFGGYGVSGWICDAGKLRQGPKLLAREAAA